MKDLITAWDNGVMAIGVTVKILRIACQNEDIGVLLQEMRNMDVIPEGTLLIFHGYSIFAEE